MANKITINVEARAQGLQKILEQIKQIQSTNGINLTGSAEKELKSLEAQLKNLLESTKGKSLLPDSEEYKNYTKELDKISSSLGKINTGFLSMRMPEQFKKQIEDAQKEIEKLKAELDSFRKSKTAAITSTRKGGAGERDIELSTRGQSVALNAGRMTGEAEFEGKAVTTWDQVVKMQEQRASLTKRQEEFLAAVLAKEEELIEAGKNARKAIKDKNDEIQKTIVLKQEEIALAAEAGLKAGTDGDTQYAADSDKVVESVGKITESLRQEKITADQAEDEAKEYNNRLDETGKTVTRTGSAVDVLNEKQEKNTNILKKAATQVISYGTIVGLLRRAYTKTIQTITKMDEALTGMAVVTTMSRAETWELVGSFQELATQTGKTGTEIANMATKFFQQGKTWSQVQELTEAAAKAATIAGIDGSRSIDLLTNAMNGFQLSADQAMQVSDKFAALAAASATDYEELAVALSKVAAQANLAGMSMDFTLGLLSKGIEVTREAPETIGTALKTVIARMRELTDYGVTLEDGMDVNRVAAALSNIGVELMDEEGQFRNLEAVITEVGMKWETLNKNQQANVAVAMAGTRQQSRLIAMMQDFGRTMELVDISTNSYGATMAQQAKYMEGMEAKTTLLNNAWETLVTNLVNSDSVIGFVDLITRLVEMADYLLNDMHLFWPIVVALGLQATSMLTTKITEYNMSKKQAILDRQEGIRKRKEQIEEIKIRQKQWKLFKKQEVKERISSLEALKIQKEQVVAQAEENLLKAKETKDSQAIAEAQKAYNNAVISLGETEQEISEAKAEEFQASQDQLNLQVLQQENWLAQIQSLGSMGGLMNALLLPMQALQSVMSVINGLQTVYNALLGKEGILRKKNKARIDQENKSKQQGAAWGMAGSAAAIPGGGWTIALAILAALGIAIALTVSGLETQKSASEQAADSINKLQAELYNINESLTTVSKLGDEFESLSSKVGRTADETNRLNEIVQELNDKGANISLTATEDIQLSQIRAYENFLERQRKANYDAQKDAFKDLTKAQEGSDSAKVKKALETQEGMQVLRTAANEQIVGLNDFSSQAKDALLDALEADAKAHPEKYINFNSSTDSLTMETGNFIGDLLSGATAGYEVSDLAANLNKALGEDDLESYITVFNNLSDAGKQTLKEVSPIFELLYEGQNGETNIFETSLQSLKELGISTKNAINLVNGLSKSGINLGNIFNDSTKDLDTFLNAGLNEIISKRGVWDAQTKAEAEAKAEEYRGYADSAYKEYEAEQKESDENNDKEIENNKNWYLKMEAEAERWQQIADNAENTVEETTEQIALFQKALDIKLPSDFVDRITKFESMTERVSKIVSDSSVDLKEQQELLADYPKLYSAIKEGGELTAEQMEELYSIMYESDKTDLINNIKKEWLNLKAELAKPGYNLGTDVINTLVNDLQKIDSKTGEEVWKSLVGLKEGDAGWDSFVQTYAQGSLATAEALMGTINTMAQHDLNLSAMGESWADMASGEAVKKLQERVSGISKITKSLDREKEILDKMDEDSDAYAAAMAQRNINLSNAIAAGTSKLEEAEQEVTNRLSFISSGVNFGSDIWFQDGELMYNEEWFNSLSEREQNLFKAEVGWLEDKAENYGEHYDQLIEWREEYSENLISQWEHETEKETEELEKRKEAYETYFEEIDALEEEEEQTENRQSLVNQIQALTSATDVASKAKLKELRQQLEEANKEALQAQKEEERDALLDSIDDKIESLNETLQELISALKAEDAAWLAELLGGTVEYNDDGSIKNIAGIAMTAADQTVIAKAEDAVANSINGENAVGDKVLSSNVTFNDLIIQTEQLNTELDFEAMANKLFDKVYGELIKTTGVGV